MTATKNEITLIGDVHGEHHALRAVLQSTENEVICVGDLAVGFPGIGARPFFRNNFKFIRGNHDCPQSCRTHPQYIGDYAMYRGMFCMGGARSIDWEQRIEGYTWWRDEHLSERDLRKAVSLYEANKPDIVITHDCPWSLQDEICDYVVRERPYMSHWGRPIKYPTTLAMDKMLEIHRPKLWIFGHWHNSFATERSGTVFRCLNILETMPLTLTE